VLSEEIGELPDSESYVFIEVRAKRSVTDATPGTRFMLMAGKPYRETPVFNGPFVD
jgi:redox-sensitive bicupin YhaK (pirin superfamily)